MKCNYELVINNARIIDGTGEPSTIGSVAVQNGRIAAVGTGPYEGIRAVDAHGLYLAPGFIDCHSHGDMLIGNPFVALTKISQGITTEIAGQCGISMFPIIKNKMGGFIKQLLGDLPLPEEYQNLQSMNAFLDYVKTQSLEINTATFVGHCNIRLAVMGYDNREPTQDELDQMKTIVRDAMEHGALGLSTGLIYTPGSFAKTAEIIELCKVVSEYDGIYATHMRNESGNVLASVLESIQIAEQANVPILISHIKVMGKKNWGLSSKVLETIDNAIQRGVRITMDQYPYTATSTMLNICIPHWHFTKGIDGLVQSLSTKEVRQTIRKEMLNPDSPFENHYIDCGGFGGILVVTSPNCKEAEGLTVEEYANKVGKDPFDTYFDLVQVNEGGGNAVFFCLEEEDIFRFIRNENCVVGTDGLCASPKSKAHPRAFGTFPRAIRYFVIDNHLMNLEKMVHKMTGLTAARMKLTSKGKLAAGYDADMVLFSGEDICDKATYANPVAFCSGIEAVYVGGQLAYHDNKLTGAGAGQFITFR